MKEKYKLQAKNVVNADEDNSIIEIARKKGIKMPSEHLAIFKTIYAKIEEPNLNGIRLGEKAVHDSLQTLIGSQVNFEHLQCGFICGNILDAWINANNEIEVVYSFFKAIYPEEYQRALELIEENTLSVSFELLADRTSQEHLADGTTRLNDITFIGMGFLFDNPPAYPGAKVTEFAKKVKNRLSTVNNKDMVFAKEINDQCDKILSEHDDPDEVLTRIFVVTSSDDRHFHVAELDLEGNGSTIITEGEDKESHVHPIMNWQVQQTDEHVHRIQHEIYSKLKNYINSQSVNKDKENLNTKKTEETKLTEEQIKQVEALRAELGDLVKDVDDKDLLDEAKVAEFRKVKEEADSKKAEDKKDDKDADKEDAKSDLEKAQERIAELEAENDKLQKTIESKDSEIEAVRENAEKIATLKIELKDNPHVADFSDEDYLDSDKVERAKKDKEFDDMKAENEKLKKAQEAKEKEDAKDSKQDKKEEKASEDKDEDLEVGAKTKDEDINSSRAINQLFK